MFFTPCKRLKSSSLSSLMVWIHSSFRSSSLKRLKKEIKPDLLDPEKEVSFSTEAPKRTDLGEKTQNLKWVYVISNPAYKGEYKVGIAKDWQARLNSYQTADPDRAYYMEV